MKINDLKPRYDLSSSSTPKVYDRLKLLLKVLRTRDLSQETIQSINKELEEIDLNFDSGTINWNFEVFQKSF